MWKAESPSEGFFYHATCIEIYYAFIHWHVLHGVEIYANRPTKRTYLDKLMNLNNKLLRIHQCKPITTPIRELYKTYNTLLITYLHKQQLLLFVHKFIHHPELLPEILSIINSSLLTMKFMSIILELSLTSIYISQLLLQDLDQWVAKPLYCGMNWLWL